MGRLGKFVSPLLAIFLAGCATSESISNTHGPAAKQIANLSHALSITFLITTVVMWVLLAVATRNRGSLKEHMPIDVGGGQDWVWIGGVIVPFVVISVFFFLGLNLLRGFPIHGDHGAMNAASRTGGSRPDILIIGHQWWWEVHYLGASGQQVITANEIHIPARRPVNIEVRTADVIHAFWVPSLHGKVDLLPGNVNYIRIEASEPGTYLGQCAEYCGKQHANMHILVIAQQAPAFEQWLASQARPAVEPTNAETTMGRQEFLAGPCKQCHTVRGTPASGRFGPDLTHLGSRREIGANSFPNSNAYLEGWIANAQALKPGCKMPKIVQYNGAQLRSLIAYLRELQ